MTRRVPVRWVLPVIAVALVAATWFVPEPEPQKVAGGSSTVPVEQTTWACPVQSDWTVAAGQVAPGEKAVATAMPADAAVDPVWASTDRWRTAEPGGDALVLQQSGEKSGSVGFVAGAATKAQGGGAVLGSCPAIVDDAWFVGLGDDGRSAATVTLVNLGETRAVADLTWWGEAGPIQSIDTTGIVVEAGERREVSVESVAAGEGAVAAHVSRRRGALTAIALDGGRGGADLVAPTAGAATEQVLAGLPAGGDSARVRLVNPGTTTAHVAIDVAGKEGSFGAEGLDDVVVDPESTKVVEVPKSVAVGQSSLLVSSDVAVVASALVEADDDVAHVVAATPWSGPAIVPVTMAGSRVGVTVTAGASEVSISVESFSASMESLGTSDLAVAAGSSSTVPVAAKGAAYVVLTPAAGATVWAGLWQRDDEVLAAAPVRPAPVTVVAPGVTVR